MVNCLVYGLILTPSAPFQTHSADRIPFIRKHLMIRGLLRIIVWNIRRDANLGRIVGLKLIQIGVIIEQSSALILPTFDRVTQRWAAFVRSCLATR